ncbi:uracil-DNA glycosylase family protein [Natrialba sp. INN-245]|uniref:uracil-DNA glycosylase family protein n=1 Tax=Natrialba sp. INN-245 TaxID=2690967 RepID=UPI0013128176|nr:uracil-DNA glycosylase family protein [Natrialba sp. INN-245]MWV38835.1 hypothetical protein [Natrialba sp. INN-245]
MNLADEIVRNAQEGDGPCASCPAHEATEGWCVNPGLSNPDAEVMFVTEEPSHSIDWGRYETWASYNEEYTRKFQGWKGGRFLQRQYLDPFGLALDDAWIADSLKCRPEDEKGSALFDKNSAAQHCLFYLKDEIATVDPQVIVTLGAAATERTLRAVGVSAGKARRLKVSQDFGRCEFDTDWPVIITLHWAQRTVKHSEFLPVVKQALKDVLNENQEPLTGPETRSNMHRTDEKKSTTTKPSINESKTETYMEPSDHLDSNAGKSRGTNSSSRDVFLVPFDHGNFERTMADPVDLAEYPECAPELSGQREARFWGTRDGSRNRRTFEQMTPGDLLLFYNNGQYVSMGRVGKTFDDSEKWVSTTFWGGAPSSLIYTVINYESISVPRKAMNKIFGYKSQYYPQGITRVADDRVNNSITVIRQAIQTFTKRNSKV